MLIANILLLVYGLWGARYFAKVLTLPKYALNAIVMALCVVGTYAVQNSFFDIEVMLVFAILGYIMAKINYPRASLVLALILGPILESNLRRALFLAKGDGLRFLKGFTNRPIAGVIMLITVAMVVLSIVQEIMVRKTDNSKTVAASKRQLRASGLQSVAAQSNVMVVKRM